MIRKFWTKWSNSNIYRELRRFCLNNLINFLNVQCITFSPKDGMGMRAVSADIVLPIWKFWHFSGNGSVDNISRGMSDRHGKWWKSSCGMKIIYFFAWETDTQASQSQKKQWSAHLTWKNEALLGNAMPIHIRIGHRGREKPSHREFLFTIVVSIQPPNFIFSRKKDRCALNNQFNVIFTGRGYSIYEEIVKICEEVEKVFNLTRKFSTRWESFQFHDKVFNLMRKFSIWHKGILVFRSSPRRKVPIYRDCNNGSGSDWSAKIYTPSCIRYIYSSQTASWRWWWVAFAFPRDELSVSEGSRWVLWHVSSFWQTHSVLLYLLE
jgi:hypothetical protein